MDGVVYRVVFDSTQSPYRWLLGYSPVLLLGILLIVIVGALLLVARRTTWQTRVLLGLLLALLSLKVAWNAYFWRLTSQNYYHYVGSYQTAEGAVEKYRAGRTTSLPYEQFEVNGIEFGYMDGGPPKCYHKTAANGGPIREGLRVRISYAQLHFTPCIVKLEVVE
jgi:hypothetical protein